MKRIFRYITMAVVSAFAFASCTDENPFTAEEGEVNVRFSAVLDEGNDAGRSSVTTDPDVNQLYYTVYKAQQSGDNWIDVAGGTARITGSQITTEGITLVKNQAYRVVFWAQKDNYFIEAPAEGEYPVLGTLNLTDEKLAGNADAFYAVLPHYKATGGTTAVTLKRPFTQFNFYTTAKQLTSRTLNVTFGETLYNSFNIITGNATDKSATKEVTADVAVESNTETINGETVRRFAKFYVLAPADSKNIDVTFSLSEGGENTYSVTAPWQQNYCVRIAGNVVEATAWDGYTLTPPKTTPDKCSVTGYALHVESPDQLAHLLKKGTQATTIHICADMDMGGYALDEIANLPANATISGLAADGETKHVIKNLNLNNVQGLFGNTANNLKINNLEIGGVTLNSESTDNVGVLLGKAEGGLTMTNVTVSDCTVKGKRNVGGFVGYVDGNAEFNGCTSAKVSTTASGDPATILAATDYKTTGAIVGVFKGNAEGETLTFDADCSITSYTTGAGAYIAANQSCWVADGSETWSGTPDSKYDNALGNEEFCRGTVTYGTVRIIPHWDGIRRVTPITESGVILINSPFDLANLQRKDDDKDNTTYASVKFVTDVDLAGKTYEPIYKITNLDGNNKTLYGLKVDTKHRAVGGDLYGGGFMRVTGGGTHKNFTIKGADVKVLHEETSGNAYAGVLSAAVSSSQTIQNVHIKDSKLYAVCKMGGLVGRVNGGTFNCIGCTVDNCEIENYNANDKDEFPISGTMSSITATAYADFGTSGEAGGLIGFISTDANITNCKVSKTVMNCFGQRDQEVAINAKLGSIGTHGYYLVAGRHVNEFIGDILTDNGDKITIKGCQIEDNSYGVKSTKGDDTHPSNLHNYHFYKSTRSNRYDAVKNGYIYDSNIKFQYKVEASTPFVGCVYYVGIDATILGITIRYGDTRGTVTIDDLVLDSIDEFVGGPLNNIANEGISSRFASQIKYPAVNNTAYDRSWCEIELTGNVDNKQ